MTDRDRQKQHVLYH